MAEDRTVALRSDRADRPAEPAFPAWVLAVSGRTLRSSFGSPQAMAAG